MSLFARLSLVALLYATTLTAQETTPNEDFENFLSKFTASVPFQYARIKFPLESPLLVLNDDGEEIPVAFVRKMWPLLDAEAFRVYRTETQDEMEGVYVAQYVLDEADRKEFEAGYEDGELDLRVVFNRGDDGNWYVTDAYTGWYSNDMSIADLDEAIRQVAEENQIFQENTQSPVKEETSMKELHVEKLFPTSPLQASALPAVMDAADIAFEAIDVVNWAAFPYKPDVRFRIAYTDTAILLHYRVTEEAVRAVYTDGGDVWTDSCVEFFISPVDDGTYYNLESNCVGGIILGGGMPGGGRGRASGSVMREIERWASLGDKPFGERDEATTWDVALIVPLTAFYLHSVASLEGKQMRANFYKCGDKLPKPHYLSWNPIDTPRPNFHQPQFFGTLVFEP
jgi:hypothetical protein